MNYVLPWIHRRIRFGISTSGRNTESGGWFIRREPISGKRRFVTRVGTPPNRFVPYGMAYWLSMFTIHRSVLPYTLGGEGGRSNRLPPFYRKGTAKNMVLPVAFPTHRHRSVPRERYGRGREMRRALYRNRGSFRYSDNQDVWQIAHRFRNSHRVHRQMRN